MQLKLKKKEMKKDYLPQTLARNWYLTLSKVNLLFSGILTSLDIIVYENLSLWKLIE